MDKSFKTDADFNNATPEEIAAANDDVLDFLNEAAEADRKLRGPDAPEPSAGKGKRGRVDKEIFGNPKEVDLPREPGKA